MKTRTNPKRILSMLLALMMVLTLLPTVALAAPGDVDINEANFPDAVFQKYVSDEFDTDEDDILSAAEIASAKTIYITNKEIASLKGVEYLTALEKLTCSDNQLTSLDLSKNTALKELSCSDNQLTSLDLSKNTALTKLICTDNQLTSLDVSKNTALSNLYCANNNLTSLNLGPNTALSNLFCSNNQLTGLDVSGNTGLVDLDCSTNQLTGLDLSKNTALTLLDCTSNKLTALDVSKNTVLQVLNVGKNALTSLDVSHNTILNELMCYENQLTSLDVSHNTGLVSVNWGHNSYSITLGTENTFDLSTLPGFDVSKASNFNGGTVSGSILTATANEITYKYDCGNSMSDTFKLTTLKAYTVTYKANGGINPPAAETVTVTPPATSATCTLAGKGTMTKSGYAFLGWATSSLADLAAHVPDPETITSPQVSANMTVYAVWGVDRNDNGVWDKRDTIPAAGRPTYTVPTVKKTLVDDDPIPAGFNEVFNAKIEAVSTNVAELAVSSMPMPETATVSTPAFTAAGEKDFASFGDITFAATGIYVYRITETAGSTAGMTYDKSEYELTVTVTNGAEGFIAIGEFLQTKDLEGTRLQQPAVPNKIFFANTYSAPAAGATYTVPTVKKTLNGTIPTGFSEAFTAKLEAIRTDVAGMTTATMPMPASSTSSTEAFTATGEKDFAAFGNITFTEEGNYFYKITETAGSTAGMTYDKSEYELAVRVYEGQNGDLETYGFFRQTKDSEGEDIGISVQAVADYIPFNNTYESSTYTVPAPKKELAGTIPAGFSTTFSAKIEAFSTTVTGLAVNSMPMTASATATTEAFTAAGEKDFASFGNITFTAAGQYVYKITETAGSTAGMTYDKSEYQITVNVIDGQNGPVVSNVDLLQTKGMDGTSYPQAVHPNVYRFYNTYTKPSDPGSNVTRYTLTFDSNGGSNINSITRTSGTTIDLTPYVPTREGYTFNGWYADKSISEKVTSVKLTKDMTVYAGWTFKGALNADDHVAYVIGYPDGTVGPDRNITRAETAMMLYRLLTPERRAEITVATSSFPDVDINAWYGVAASSMAKGGYIVGYDDGTFGGNRPITRAEFVTMLVRFIGKAEGSKSFSDVPTTYWAYEFISTATAAGWIDGYTDGTFGPEKPITRAEAMTIINRVLNRGVDADSELLDFNVWPDNKKDAWYYYDIIEATNAHEYTGARPSEDWTTILK